MGSYWAAMVKFWNQTIAESAEFLITFSHIAKLEENIRMASEETVSVKVSAVCCVCTRAGASGAYFSRLERRLAVICERASASSMTWVCEPSWTRVSVM